MDRQELYDAVGIQRLADLYIVALGGEKGQVQVAGAGAFEVYVVTQWGLIQVFVAPARQGVKGVVRGARFVRTTLAASRSSKPAAKAAPKKFDMFAEKYYRLPPSKRFAARRKDLYEQSTPLQRELLEQIIRHEAMTTDFNPIGLIGAVLGGSAFVIGTLALFPDPWGLFGE